MRSLERASDKLGPSPLFLRWYCSRFQSEKPQAIETHSAQQTTRRWLKRSQETQQQTQKNKRTYRSPPFSFLPAIERVLVQFSSFRRQTFVQWGHGQRPFGIRRQGGKNVAYARLNRTVELAARLLRCWGIRIIRPGQIRSREGEKGSWGLLCPSRGAIASTRMPRTPGLDAAGNCPLCWRKLLCRLQFWVAPPKKKCAFP